MNSKLSTVKRIVVAAALVAGVSGMARADDSSMNPFIGDSYADFSGGNLPKIGNPVYDKSPSAWRQSNPNGLSERQFQSLATFGPMVYKPAPVFDDAPSVWRQSHPNGLSERELQALGSEASAWHPSDKSATSAFASTGETSYPSAKDATDTGKPTLAQRLASLLHLLNGSPSQSNH
jgi:hypothetical protein